MAKHMSRNRSDGRRQLALLLIAIAGWLLAFGTMVAYEAKQPRVIGPICAHADVNCDRSIDVLDVQLVVNAVLKGHNSRLEISTREDLAHEQLDR